MTREIFLIRILLTVMFGLFTGNSYGKDLKGRVTCEGKGLSKIVVTDGTDCVLTDAEGRFHLEAKCGVRFVYLSMPSGYLAPCEQGSIPIYYKKIEFDTNRTYDFELQRNPMDDTHHLFTFQADVQVTSEKDIRQYTKYMKEMKGYVASYKDKMDVFGIDCGDMVGDSSHLFPSYLKAAAKSGLPIFRSIGNHDMTYGGRTYEYSYSKFEELFGPCYYSFNKGRAHYIVLNNNFYVGRDYQYIGYIDERIFTWMEQDLKQVPKGSLVFVVAHIPTSLTKELQWNALIQDETSNAASLYELLKEYNAHLLTGHTHFNLNVCFNPHLMEHNTASVCGIWWKSDICMDGTPAGYGVFEVNGNHLTWLYKGFGLPEEYQLRVYPAGCCEEYPQDIVANVWNWDEQWQVEWYENGKRMGKMTRFTGYDPEAHAICSDKKRVEYDWITPAQTGHLFRATPQNPKAKIEVRVKDRFGREFIEEIN